MIDRLSRVLNKWGTDRFSELQAFVAVIDAGGFSAAARQTGQSRSSVNRVVIALEERLGVQLLNRTTRSVSPTSTGQALYERARRLLDDLEEVEVAVSSARTDPVGKLRITAPQSLGELDFSALITSFMQAHPRVEIDVIFDTRFVDPVAEGYDLAIRIAEPDEETTLVDHRILELGYLLCAAPAYLAGRSVPRTPADLRDHAVLYQSLGARTPTWTLIGSQGPVKIPLTPALTSNTLDILLTGARQGLGIAIMPEYAVRSDLAGGRLEHVLPDYVPLPRMLQVIYPPSRHLSAGVRLFTEFVETWCGAS